jgi:Rps23 Pro-64 3,4-dihydroxylase Tpa1-like proline 4-hydroxylase
MPHEKENDYMKTIDNLREIRAQLDKELEFAIANNTGRQDELMELSIALSEEILRLIQEEVMDTLGEAREATLIRWGEI